MKKFFILTCLIVGLSLFVTNPAFAQSSACPYSMSDIEYLYRQLVHAQRNVIANPDVLEYRGRLIVINEQLKRLMITPGCEYTQEFLSPALKQSQVALGYGEQYWDHMGDLLSDISRMVW